MGMFFTEVDGAPMEEPDVDRWLLWRRCANRVVDQTTIGGVMVSTVFMGINFRCSDGPPLLYETTVFGGIYNMDKKLSETRAQALVAHRQAVELAKGK